MLTTHEGPTVERRVSPFVLELREGAGPELRSGCRARSRRARRSEAAEAEDDGRGRGGDGRGGRSDPGPRPPPGHAPADRPRAPPGAACHGHPSCSGSSRAPARPTPRPRTPAAPWPPSWPASGTGGHDRRRGPRPRPRSADDADRRPRQRLGREPARGRRPPPAASATASSTVYERCPLQYAFRHVYRFPEPEGRAALTFGSTAHAAFERFTKERRERAARGEPPPTREDLERLLRRGVEARHLRRPRPPRTATGPGPARCSTRSGRASSPPTAARCSARRSRSSSSSSRPTGRPPVTRPRLDRPDRPAGLGRHRGPRLQDRPARQPEGRGREPPAVDLRAGLPRRAGPRDAGAGDPLLHRGGDPDDDDPDRRAARRGPRGHPGAGGPDPLGRLRGDAGQGRQDLRAGATSGRCARRGRGRHGPCRPGSAAQQLGSEPSLPPANLPCGRPHVRRAGSCGGAQSRPKRDSEPQEAASSCSWPENSRYVGTSRTGESGRSDRRCAFSRRDTGG